ncbi:uncharacterized protein LOC100575607 [Acyrthosiphon pisum]|uniref:Uncharacterized protein n=1 Tax=Acyrthosiphon pisum TaxID=7029 RepID=A0A8R2FCJ9_ACYPI|nr:uncharacterized protein LOC100575607 [Acyrthosiphon pisum]XP_016662835.1 uncharacterized protein LOC100575607 [Acyrthosiphon pisum]XP_029347155.1 uncharacterized protein LOC100575607 [Acyrthosiphon pisum]|eukprot:XP_008186593.1 PREDICTED: uncharacterized protein LOC100575607 [Acyrthosiphon pisum]
MDLWEKFRGSMDHRTKLTTGSCCPRMAAFTLSIRPACTGHGIFTLLVYVKLSYLRNFHGYYLMCYEACLLVMFVCEITDLMTQDDINSPLSIPFDMSYMFLLIRVDKLIENLEYNFQDLDLNRKKNYEFLIIHNNLLTFIFFRILSRFQITLLCI